MRFIKKLFLGFKTKASNERENVRVEKGVRLNKKVKIGFYTFIGKDSNIGDNCSEIGRYCSIGQNSLIGPNIHPYNRLSTSAIFYSSAWGVVSDNEKESLNNRPVTLGSDVWVGAYSIVLPGVKVGHGAIIGANSVVTKDVPDYAIVAGNPAKIIKFRFDEEVIVRLLELCWWDMKPEEALNEYRKFEEEK
ncbi:CatB-related O-acetyltransferase [Pseudoalteromonas sp. L23]|uniref:CatB-related O-acetyltransferase n=1 Tax=unclassified Pseudoalteromonas TaxID=194690 RepID=UPI001EF13FAE|nr:MULTISPECIES: CatB-related O-acetyltransferase [unclassified Pseudoalteromonas]MCF7513923.1 CatB-related O-acetyltransferase [Pseudoalteromonas sp. L7]MCF7525964.1 CatB-related O-acetyltransferase [Pseudoalteromonas sp. L23]MCX2766941.1 CatB-related O-acetyltransferase [Pseudoalteromonas sp. B530]